MEMRRSQLTPTERLIRKLEEAGFRVRIFVPTVGHWRLQDVWRWEAHAIRVADGLACELGSYHTITACARNRIEIVPDAKSHGAYEVLVLKKKVEDPTP